MLKSRESDNAELCIGFLKSLAAAMMIRYSRAMKWDDVDNVWSN